MCLRLLGVGSASSQGKTCGEGGAPPPTPHTQLSQKETLKGFRGRGKRRSQPPGRLPGRCGAQVAQRRTEQVPLGSGLQEPLRLGPPRFPPSRASPCLCPRGGWGVASSLPAPFGRAAPVGGLPGGALLHSVPAAAGLLGVRDTLALWKEAGHGHGGCQRLAEQRRRRPERERQLASHETSAAAAAAAAATASLSRRCLGGQLTGRGGGGQAAWQRKTSAARRPEPVPLAWCLSPGPSAWPPVGERDRERAQAAAGRRTSGQVWGLRAGPAAGGVEGWPARTAAAAAAPEAAGGREPPQPCAQRDAFSPGEPGRLCCPRRARRAPAGRRQPAALPGR